MSRRRSAVLTCVCAPLVVLTLVVATPAPAREGDSVHANPQILYVGDSLGVGTLPQLRSMLAGGRLDGYVETGRNSTEGLSVLRSKLRRRHDVVIFDLGTNDSSAATLARNLNRARRETGDRLMVVFTMNKSGVGPLNTAVRRFAGSAHNVTLIGWHSTASRTRLLAGDGIHASSSGYRRRARLIYDRLDPILVTTRAGMTESDGPRRP